MSFPLSPELGPAEIDARSIHAFQHGYPSPMVRWHFHDDYEPHLIVASAGDVFVGDYVVQFRRNMVQSMAAAAPELKGLLPLLERARFGLEFRGAVCADAELWFENIIESGEVSRIGLLIDFLHRLSHEQDYRTLSTAFLESDKAKATAPCRAVAWRCRRSPTPRRRAHQRRDENARSAPRYGIRDRCETHHR